MLNELSQVADLLERLGTVAPSRHPRINPMGKNRDLLVVSLDDAGSPFCIEVLHGETAAKLFRIEHGSAGSSFPGFNIPTPLRRLDEASADELKPAVVKLLALGKNKNSSAAEIKEFIRKLFMLSKSHTFSPSQVKQFQRSCSELVSELVELLSRELAGLKNFMTLVEILVESKPTLPSFAEALASLMVDQNSEFDRRQLLLLQEVLFGTLDWKKRTPEIASPEYWKEKLKQDRNSNQPIYLDLASPGVGFYRVAHSETSALINTALIQTQSSVAAYDSERGGLVEDAFGELAELQDKFPPGPKVAELGNVKLFSVNTNEVQALERYGFKGSQSFPVSSARVQKMSDALLYLASEDKRGVTCRAIPSAQPDKRDLLVAYLEGEPEGRVKLAEMFGGEVHSFSDADFEAIAQPVLEMLEGKVAANPNLNVRLLAFCPIDKAKKQISLNRSLRVRDVIHAAREWEAGARNAPQVSVWFYDKNTKQSVFRSHTTPCPLELTSVVNRVWSADAKSGFSSTYQRALSVGDAYDVFLADAPLARQKAQLALELLITRMCSVLIALGATKTNREWICLSDTVRWQSVKSIALLGILLQQLGHHRNDFMQESMAQIGRLLALADSLHLQYCKHVRKGDSPSQLIGNAMFNTALEQPVFALARLAERLTPYQAWARTFQGNAPEAGVGLVKYFLGEIAACTAAIRLDELPQRMTDADKAKLLLGYLADHPKTETPK
ncbi:MAG: hypothetical protein K9N62_09905 [Verrucomicrobia bacterium]|nr:hypothetical protein [Verrucomicrobiota bacterium]